MWNLKVLAVIAAICLHLECRAEGQVTYIYDPPESENHPYAQLLQGRIKTIPVRSVPKKLHGSLQTFPDTDNDTGISKIVSSDAIRIIEPPQYFRDQKHDQQLAPTQQYKQNASPYAHGSTFKEPEYLPKRGQPVQSQYLSETTPHASPYRGYSGIQAPTPDIIRSQIVALKERQKIYFPTENGDHPIRTKYRMKPVAADQPIYGHSYKPTTQNYRAGQDEYVVGNTFVVADNAGQRNSKPESMQFTPYKLLASVRHQENINHMPRRPNNPQVKERLRVKNAYTVYSEQGYDDKDYSHGEEQKRIAQAIRHRTKRQAKDVVVTPEVDRVEELPISLSLVGEKGQKLVGQDLLKHIANLIQNSKHLIPQKAPNDSAPGQELESIVLPRKGFQELYQKSMKMESGDSAKLENPSNHQPQKPLFLPVNSQIPRAEKLQGFQESPYQRTKAINCDFNVDQDFQSGGKKKKLGGGGQQIDCVKEKYFGKDPLAEKLFEDQRVKPEKVAPPSGRNPSLLVYNDVMQTIESSKNKPQARYEGSIFGLDVNPETASYPEASLPIFDITKYFPQVYMIKPNGKVYGISFKPKVVPKEQSVEIQDDRSEELPEKINYEQPEKINYEANSLASQQINGLNNQDIVNYQTQKFVQNQQYQQYQQQRPLERPQYIPQQKLPPMQRQKQPYQQPQTLQHQQKLKGNHQNPVRHYQVQHQIVQQHPVKQHYPGQQPRRPELINYNSFGSKHAPHNQQHPHSHHQNKQPGGGGVPAHTVKFALEDAVRPPQHQQRF